MSPPILPIVIENAQFIIADELPVMMGRTGGFDAVLDFCTQFRRLGIATLLLQGDPDELMRSLSYSGRALLHVLPAITDEKRATGLQTPFLDALAADDRVCAGALAAMSRQTWNVGEEHEEDFLFVAALMNLIRGDLTACTPLLDRYATIIGNDSEPRLSVLAALVGGDPEVFEAALHAHLTDVQSRYRRLASKQSIADEEAATEGHVSTEGIALVRAARQIGLRTRSVWPMVPGLVWRARWRPSDPSAWSRI